MKMMLLVLALVGLTAAGRLENTYLPPRDAALSGGQNLPLPAPSNTYLPAHTEAVQKSFTATPSAPVNTYLPPRKDSGSAVVVEANLRQSGALSSHQHQFGTQQFPSFSSFGSQQSPSFSSFGSQQSSLFAPKTSSFSSHPSLFSSQSAPHQQHSFTAPQPSPFAPKTSSYGHHQSALSSHQFGSSFPQQTTGYGYQQTASFAPKASINTVSQEASFGGYSQSHNADFTRQGFASRPIAIVRSLNENSGDGSYSYSYETENGIQAQEQGLLRRDGAEGIETVQGAFAYTGPDNVRYTVTYTADENGFQASGEHLPTPPPIPEAILRSLEFNAREEAAASRLSNGGHQQQQGYEYNRASIRNDNGGYRY